MSAARKDGGPAFPWQLMTPAGSFNAIQRRVAKNNEVDVFTGMTLRDYFAAKAMQGLMGRTHTQDERGRPFVEWATELSYEAADAMLAAREAA